MTGSIKTGKKSKGGYKDGARMPSLKRVSSLLEELNIEHSLMEWSETKQTKSGGNTYYTGGGTREYTGYRLILKNKTGGHHEMCSTDTYYSYNTWSYARDILEAIEKR